MQIAQSLFPLHDGVVSITLTQDDNTNYIVTMSRMGVVRYQAEYVNDPEGAIAQYLRLTQYAVHLSAAGSL